MCTSISRIIMSTPARPNIFDDTIPAHPWLLHVDAVIRLRDVVSERRILLSFGDPISPLFCSFCTRQGFIRFLYASSVELTISANGWQLNSTKQSKEKDGRRSLFLRQPVLSYVKRITQISTASLNLETSYLQELRHTL